MGLERGGEKRPSNRDENAPRAAHGPQRWQAPALWLCLSDGFDSLPL